MRWGRLKRFFLPALSLMIALAIWTYVRSTPISADAVHREPPTKKTVRLEPIIIKAHHPFDCEPDHSFPQLVFIPNFKSATQMIHECDAPHSKAVSSVMTIFYSNWVKKFGDPEGKVKASMNELMVEWGTAVRQVRSAYTVDGDLIENGFATGLALSPTFIWVHYDETRQISQGSMVRELVHTALWAIHGHADADHEGYKHNGWKPKHTRFIVNLNKHLYSLGL